MFDIFTLAKPFLHALPAETAHNFAVCALRRGLLPSAKTRIYPELSQNILGLTFENPVGLAAGFDKNAVAVNSLLKQGFGFVEAGTVTPFPQSGNPKPRIFRLSEDRAIINRLGFNNNGLEAFVKEFAGRDPALGIAGANIGKNKDTKNASEDYVRGLQAVYPYADYVTVNISSPNTKGLRDLQKNEALGELLTELSKARSDAILKHRKRVPMFLKIAPDTNGEECENIAENVLLNGIDGLIISNTTISRPVLISQQNSSEEGGLSGTPLFTLSTKILSEMYRLTAGKIPIIGVGGVASPEDAYAKIQAGASLVQIYSALVYQGFGLVRRINDKLPEFLARDGFANISEAVGTSAKAYFN
ncbi:MAG: quinone-dependent dihydroorotate dehydrogenase [Pseudomonadota bacterium]